MKKFAVSIGLAAVGTASIHAAYTVGSDSMQSSKIWSLSGTLRGFYDDNYTTTSIKHGSYGFEVSPAISLNMPMDQTDIGARYTYGLYYYQDRENQSLDPIDQTHQFDLWVNHAFTETWQTSVQDSFVIAQDPGLLPNGGTPLRANGNNVNNLGSVKLDTQWTRLLGTELGYQNTYIDYSDSDYVATLNRVENLLWLNFNWQLTPTLKPLIGYKFGQISYTGDKQIGTVTAMTPNGTFSDNRNNWSQYFVVGAEYDPLDNISISLQGGIQYVDYYNPAGSLSANSQIAPYAVLSANYTYLPGSYVQLGFQQSQSATDVPDTSSNGQVTESQSSSTAFASINHQFSPMLTGSAVGKIQYGTFNEGNYANASSTWYTFDINLSYSFNNHLSTQIGYNYDNYSANSALGQNYSRNQIYLSLTGTY